MTSTLLSLDFAKNNLDVSQKRNESQLNRCIEIAGKKVVEALLLVDTQLAHFRLFSPRTEFEADVVSFLLQNQDLAGSDDAKIVTGSIKVGKKQFLYRFDNSSVAGNVVFTIVK